MSEPSVPTGHPNPPVGTSFWTAPSVRSASPTWRDNFYLDGKYLHYVQVAANSLLHVFLAVAGPASMRRSAGAEEMLPLVRGRRLNAGDFEAAAPSSLRSRFSRVGAISLDRRQSA